VTLTTAIYLVIPERGTVVPVVGCSPRPDAREWLPSLFFLKGKTMIDAKKEKYRDELMQIIGLAQAGRIMSEGGVDDADSIKEIFCVIDARLTCLSEQK